MWFEIISGLRINLEKNKLIPMDNVPNMEEMVAESGCRKGELLVYLGFPL